MTQDDLIDTLRSVVEIESQALGSLAESVDQSWAKAVEIMLAAQGRIIVSGMGKSGHIARKIAATLASTGTPAQFVHPAEASHGDLGMLTTQDVVLVLSHSGETPELGNMIAYTRRFDIRLIGLTSNANSTLARYSDLILILPNVGEACGSGIVPSSSTTMALAIGDALAIAMMRRRQFSAENFREFHPGGTLGVTLSRVGDLMHTGDALPLVEADIPMGETLLIMSQKGFGVVGVIDGAGKMVGIITDGDLRRHMGTLLEMSAGDVMNETPRTTRSSALAQEALAQMNQHKITCLFVCDGTDPVGLIHVHDCLRVGLV